MDLFKSKNQQAIITERNRAAMYNEFRKSEANDINIQGGAGKWKADAIEKSKGEGSKGGKVIGHTRNGKPIYEQHDHPDHKDFEAKDHMDAYSLKSKIGHNGKEHGLTTEESDKHIVSSWAHEGKFTYDHSKEEDQKEAKSSIRHAEKQAEKYFKKRSN